RGRVLIDRFRCEACHDRFDKTASLTPNQAPDLLQSLRGINPSYIERFIADPHQVKLGTSMPQMMGGLSDTDRHSAAKAIAHYLHSLTHQPTKPLSIESLNVERGRELYHSVGCVACHAPRDPSEKEMLKNSSIPLGRLKEKYSLSGLTAFLKNPHLARPSGRMPSLELTHWEALDIAGYLLNFSKESPTTTPAMQAEIELAVKGKQQFQELGCVRCHSINRERTSPDQLAFAKMDPLRGCLSNSPGKWPRYQFTDSQRKAIQAAIRQHAPKATTEQQITNHLARLNCFACHQRNGIGGVSAEREEYYQTTNLNLGPQGRIPPALTGVGAKLESKALRDVLVNGHSVRPYMKTRMPQFGAENTISLVSRLEQIDQLPPMEFETFRDEKLIRNAGWELAGTGGLNCIACHTFQMKPAKTMPAIDLTLMGTRLNKRWFYHYLLNPQRFHPGTVMPSFWPDGKSMRKDVLQGNAKLQIEALWQYLLEGRQARTPRGLIVEPIELVATDEAVMLRRSYPSIGKRGIGVGYPHEVNLAYDAEQMRLGMIWKGKFADPGGVWRGQGHGTVRPLGNDLLRFSDGPELESVQSSWTTEQGRLPHHQFLGYVLDDKQRPTFRYKFHDVKVEDNFREIKPQAMSSSGLRRTITFAGQPSSSDFHFRAAVGKTVKPIGSDAFLVDDKLMLKIKSDRPGKVIEAATGKKLVIPLDLSRGKSQLVLEYHW
ncbi:MAG: hypothetical protein KDA84_17030, partial [Planctomycetaceae bacterium]|nr:hypothetical protein [Planctomycetaceae bacterium]